jgi:hypothetical protein
MTINAVPILIAVLCIYAIAYRFYSAFIAAKVLALDDKRVTPAHTFNDGANYTPTNKYVLWGHHFAAISGPGPLIGPVLAAQFGFLPGLLWLVIGVVLGGAVHDFIILTASMRSGGKSLAEIARREIDRVTGTVATCAILIILIVALAGVGLAVVNALAESPWGLFTIAMTIPIALLMGMYMFRWRAGSHRAITEATVVGVILLILAVVFGETVQNSAAGRYFTYDKTGITLMVAAYGFIASVLPVWLLLAPRDYLSSYMKLGSIALLALGIFAVMPTLQMPATTPFVNGGGPIIPGKVFPFVFITIACGAISGFHALVSSGTTPKMIDKETHARSIGYGAMLCESIVGVMALIAASSMFPHDYFQINVPVEAFAKIDASLRAMGWRGTARRAYGRRGQSGGWHGADLFEHSGHERADELLVSLRDHVRGPVHPDDRGRGHARGALYDAGDAGRRAQEIRPDRLAARRGAGKRAGCSSLDIPHPDRFDCDDLAAVRNGESDAGLRGALRGDDVFGQQRQSALSVGHGVAAGVYHGDRVDRWLSERGLQLLAQKALPQHRHHHRADDRFGDCDHRLGVEVVSRGDQGRAAQAAALTHTAAPAGSRAGLSLVDLQADRLWRACFTATLA